MGKADKVDKEDIIKWCEERIAQLRDALTGNNPDEPDEIDFALADNRTGSIMAYEDVINYLKGE